MITNMISLFSSAPLCPLVIPNGEVIVNSTCVGASGNTCQFMCDSGYRPRAAVQSITCTSTLDLLVAIPWDDLQWDIQDPCKGTCRCRFVFVSILLTYFIIYVQIVYVFPVSWS